MERADFNPIDHWIIGVSTVLLAVAVTLILDEKLLFQVGPSHLVGPSIAETGRVSKDVRRKYGDQFSWFSLSERENLFSSDSIFTGTDSEAQVLFHDGSELSVGPGSLITFDSTKGQPVIDVQMGSVFGTLAPHQVLLFKSHGKTGKIQGSSAKIRISATQAGDVKVSVDSGKAEVDEEGRKTSLDATGAKDATPSLQLAVAKTLPDAPSLLIPSDQAQIAFSGENFTQHFEWSPRADAKEYQVQISPDENFSDPSRIIVRKVDQAHLDEIFHLAGTYYWRIRTVTLSGAETVFSARRMFQLLPKEPLPAPSIETPNTEFEIKSDASPIGELKSELTWLDLLISSSWAGETSNKHPALVWKPIEGATHYQVEIAKSEDFAQNIVDAGTKIPGFVWEEAIPGHFFWRVRAVDKDGMSGKWSGTGVLNVTVPPLTLIEEKDKDEIVHSLEEMNGPLPKIELKWKEAPLANRYEVITAFDSEDQGGRVERTREVETHSVEVVLPKSGIIYWKVRALAKDGTPIGKFSKTGVVRFRRTLALLAPELRSPSDGEKTVLMVDQSAQPRHFAWTSSAPGVHYRVEVAQDPDFKSLIKVTTLSSTETTLQNLPKSGLFYWRVRAEKEDITSSWSNTRKFETLTENPLIAEKMPKKVVFQASLDATVLSYTETSSADLSEVLLGPDGGVRIPLPLERLDFKGGMFLGVPLTSNLSPVSMVLFGGNYDVNYNLPQLKSPWTLEVYSGIFFRTTFVTNNVLGYNSLMGPQIGFAFKRDLSPHQSLSASVRYSSDWDHLVNHEFTWGLEYDSQIAHGFPIFVKCDYSSLRLAFSNVLFMVENTVTLGVGTRW